MEEGVKHKRCTVCGEPKTLDAFYIRSGPGRKTTHVSACKDCKRRCGKERYARDPGPIKEKARKSYADNPEAFRAKKYAWRDANKESVLNACRKTYWKDPEVHRARARKSRLVNIIAVRERDRKRYLVKKLRDPEYFRTAGKRASAIWRTKHPEAVRNANRRWRWANFESEASRHQHRRFSSAGGRISDVSARRVLAQTHCTYCDCELTSSPGPTQRTLDHILALARGGTNHDSNLTAACRTCNFSKHDRILVLEWVPTGLVRDRVYTHGEVETYRVEEVARQRLLLSNTTERNDAESLATRPSPR